MKRAGVSLRGPRPGRDEKAKGRSAKKLPDGGAKPAGESPAAGEDDRQLASDVAAGPKLTFPSYPFGRVSRLRNGKARLRERKEPEPLKQGPRPRTRPALYAGRPARYAPRRAGAILVENLFGTEQGPPPLQALPDVHAIISFSNGRFQITT